MCRSPYPFLSWTPYSPTWRQYESEEECCFNTTYSVSASIVGNARNAPLKVWPCCSYRALQGQWHKEVLRCRCHVYPVRDAFISASIPAFPRTMMWILWFETFLQRMLLHQHQAPLSFSGNLRSPPRFLIELTSDPIQSLSCLPNFQPLKCHRHCYILEFVEGKFRNLKQLCKVTP